MQETEGREGDALLGMGQASELRGSPEENWPVSLGKSKPSSLEQAGTSYRGLCMCYPVLLPLWLLAHTEQGKLHFRGQQEQEK